MKNEEWVSHDIQDGGIFFGQSMEFSYHCIINVLSIVDYFRVFCLLRPSKKWIVFNRAKILSGTCLQNHYLNSFRDRLQSIFGMNMKISQCTDLLIDISTAATTSSSVELSEETLDLDVQRLCWFFTITESPTLYSPDLSLGLGSTMMSIPLSRTVYLGIIFTSAAEVDVLSLHVALYQLTDSVIVYCFLVTTLFSSVTSLNYAYAHRLGLQSISVRIFCYCKG